MPTLVIFGGLPGTGKTSISRQLAARLGATYLRIDAVENAVRNATGNDEVGVIGYVVAYALAESNLSLGQSVVADCVNPLEITRRAWREVAARTGALLVGIEIVCSDVLEHKRRVEGRVADTFGAKLPDWQTVMKLAREYEPWTDPSLVIDTAKISADDAASMIVREIEVRAGRFADEPSATSPSSA